MSTAGFANYSVTGEILRELRFCPELAQINLANSSL